MEREEIIAAGVKALHSIMIGWESSSQAGSRHAIVEVEFAVRQHGDPSTELVEAVYAAVEPLIRADERERICRAEGHDPAITTTIDQAEEHLLCKRCGHAWTEPFACTCEFVADRATCKATEHDPHVWVKEYGGCAVKGCHALHGDPGWADHDRTLIAVREEAHDA